MASVCRNSFCFLHKPLSFHFTPVQFAANRIWVRSTVVEVMFILRAKFFIKSRLSGTMAWCQRYSATFIFSFWSACCCRQVRLFYQPCMNSCPVLDNFHLVVIYTLHFTFPAQFFVQNMRHLTSVGIFQILYRQYVASMHLNARRLAACALFVVTDFHRTFKLPSQVI